MSSARVWIPCTLAVLAAFLGGAGYWVFFRPPDLADARLTAFVHGRPPVPVVFTSRSEPASFAAAAPEGEGYRFPGQPLWAAREGRLRLLTADGRVLELTWNRTLPDGSTLIDVMSPSVTRDGTKILFAGRASKGHGRFRLYEVGVDGQGLRQLTGGPDDEGATALPPMRYPAGDGKQLLPAEERRRIDFDDVDPTDGALERIVFASSRTPDLGRGHARRSTTIWEFDTQHGIKRPLTSNRNNDRWPYLLANGFHAFSLWSRNTEVITADGKDIRPLKEGETGLTQPTDAWMGAIVDQAGSPRMAGLIKVPEPVWRPRPLFREAIAYMTWERPGLPRLDRPADLAALRVRQSPPELIISAPNSHVTANPLPTFGVGSRTAAPDRDADGRPLALATPSPCPDAEVLLSGAVTADGAEGPTAGAFGLYLASDDWQSPERANVRRLFDDPELVDAEPAAVYARTTQYGLPEAATTRVPVARAELLSGRLYQGPTGTVHGDKVYDSFLDKHPGQKTDAGEGPVFGPAPRGSFKEIRVYASYRDRFDDPVEPRVVGGWEALTKGPVTQVGTGGFRFDVPAGVPTVLAGFDAEGRVVRHTTTPKDAAGRQADLLYFAGDHYSGVKPGGYHFCTGCHTGHSILDVKDYKEKRR